MPYNAEPTRYDSMQYRNCGNSGLKLSVVSLGLWHNFGGGSSYENARAIVRRSFDCGITCFDLANNYGPPPGSAEECFGRIMKDDMLPYRDEMVVTTKAGYRMWPGPYGDLGSRKYMLTSLDQSLKRMGLDYVDIFYHHRMDANTPLEETMSALADAVKSGKALYVGISNYNAENTVKASRILKEMKTPFIINQIRYNMLARDPENNGILDAIAQEGIGCTAYSPLAQGLLSGKYSGGIPEDSRAAGHSTFFSAKNINEEAVEKAFKLGQFASQRGQTTAQLALTWLLRHPHMASVLIGASKPEQIDENVMISKQPPLTDEEIAIIEGILQ